MTSLDAQSKNVGESGGVGGGGVFSRKSEMGET